MSLRNQRRIGGGLCRGHFPVIPQGIDWVSIPIVEKFAPLGSSSPDCAGKGVAGWVNKNNLVVVDQIRHLNSWGAGRRRRNFLLYKQGFLLLAVDAAGFGCRLRPTGNARPVTGNRPRR